MVFKSFVVINEVFPRIQRHRTWFPNFVSHGIPVCNVWFTLVTQKLKTDAFIHQRQFIMSVHLQIFEYFNWLMHPIFYKFMCPLSPLISGFYLFNSAS